MSARVGEWEVCGVLGHGTQGTVYAARDDAGREAAVKVLNEPARSERFFEVARAVAAIEHPGVVHILGHGTDGEGRAFIAMERLRGETLYERCRRAPLSLDETVGVIRQLCGALAAAHARGIVHRDVKPENVFLEDGRVVLVDFGIARLGSNRPGTLTGTGAFGTPPYMSPEQRRSAAVDARSDLYALGCVLYELISGAPPAPDVSVPLRDTVDTLPAALDALSAELLAPEPSLRPASARAVLDALDAAALEGRPPAPLPARLPTLVPATADGWRDVVWSRLIAAPAWAVGGAACAVGSVMLGASIVLGVGDDYLASPNWAFSYAVLVPLALMLMSSAARRCHAALETPRLGRWLIALFALYAPLSIAVTVMEFLRRAPKPGLWWSDAPLLGAAAAAIQGLFGALILLFIVHAVGWAHVARERRVEAPEGLLAQMLGAGALVQLILYLADVQYVAEVRGTSIASVMLPLHDVSVAELGRYQSVVTVVTSAMVAGFLIAAMRELKHARPAAVSALVALAASTLVPVLGPPVIVATAALALRRPS